MNNCKYHWQLDHKGMDSGEGDVNERVCENTVKGAAVKHDERTDNNNIDAVICVSHRSREPR